MNLDEVIEWSPFTSTGGEVYDLTFLNAKKITYVHSAEGKIDKEYHFWVTYSSHCFTKDYESLTDVDRAALNYHAPRESRPFCFDRYELARQYLCNIIENLSSPGSIILDGGYKSYITTKIIMADGQELWYHVPFKVYRERKKYRIHVMSAYPSTEKRGGGKVGFFKIAYNLLKNKRLPENPSRQARNNKAR